MCSWPGAVRSVQGLFGVVDMWAGVCVGVVCVNGELGVMGAAVCLPLGVVHLLRSVRQGVGEGRQRGSV